MSSARSIIHSTSNNAAENSELVLDQQSIGKDKSSLVQVIKIRPREAGNNICTQVEGMHQDTDISLEEECIEPISAHEMWEIDD